MRYSAIACGIGKAVSSYSSLSPIDTPWSVAPFAIWSEAEQAVAILCACLPTIVGGVRNIMKTRRETSAASPYRTLESGHRKNPQPEWAKDASINVQAKRSSMSQALRAKGSLDDDDDHLESLPQRKWDEFESTRHSIEMARLDRSRKPSTPIS